MNFTNKFENGELNLKEIFGNFFWESAESENLVTIGTNRKDFLEEYIPLRSKSNDAVLESESEDSDEESNEKWQNNKFESFLHFDIEWKFEEKCEKS